MAEEVTSAPESKETQTTGDKPAAKKSSAKIVIIIVAVLAFLMVGFIALLVGAFLFINSATNAPVDTSKKMIVYIQNGEPDLAYNLFSSGAQATVSEEEFASISDQIGPILQGEAKVVSKNVNKTSGGSNQAEVIYEIKGTDGATYVFTVNLVEESGNWKVLNFDSSVKE